MSVYGGVEAGGTKIVCAIGSGPDKLETEISFATTTPQETITRIIAFFREYQQREQLSAVGIGSFGPIDLDPRHPSSVRSQTHRNQAGRTRNFLGGFVAP